MPEGLHERTSLPSLQEFRGVNGIEISGCGSSTLRPSAAPVARPISPCVALVGESCQGMSMLQLRAFKVDMMVSSAL